jgi:hypothetical protein
MAFAMFFAFFAFFAVKLRCGLGGSILRRIDRSEDQLDHGSDAVVDLVGRLGDGCGFTVDDGIGVGGELPR